MRTDLVGAKREMIADGRLQVVFAGAQDILISHTAETASAVARFDRFVAAVASQGLAFRSLSGCERLIACVIAFDATCTADLKPILQALQDPLHLGDGYYVSWKYGEEIRRVKLCALTLAVREQVPTWDISWDDLIDSFSRASGSIYLFGAPTRIDGRLDAMFADRMAWSFLHLPMPLVSHVLGIDRVTLLPDSAWLRRFGIPVPEPEVGSDSDIGLEPVEEAVTEILYGGQSQLSAAWFVNELVNICAGLTDPGVSMSDAGAWTELSRRLTSLAAKLDMAGPTEALLLGWALDIATFGTARKKKPRVKTLANYLRSGVQRIRDALRESGQHPLSLTDQSWNELFLAIEESGQHDQTLRPALASFQRYLVRSIDAAPIPRLWSVHTEVFTPKTSVIWAHEFEKLDRALDQMTPDPRIRDQLAVWTALLRTTTLRFGELAGLQMRSVQLGESTLEIQVAPHRGHRPLKTAAARRIVAIQDPHATRVIRDWFGRRRLEVADTVDFLFGDPADRRQLYRLGASYRIFSGALKLATSDPTMTIHGTRHAFLSRAAEDVLLGIEVGGQINPLHRLAVLAGHEHEHTTLRTYVHLFEAPMRHFTDRAVERHLKHHSDVARWLGLKADTVRQRNHRRRGGVWSPWVDIEKRFLHPSPSLVDPADSSDHPEVGIRVRPIARFKQFVQVAEDLLDGHSEIATGARNSIDLQAISRVRDSIVATALTSDARWADPISLSARLNFSRLVRGKWDAAVRTLEQPEARSAVGALWPALRGAGIDVEMASSSLLPALEFLRACGFSAPQFVLRYVPESGASSPMPLPSMKAARTFSTAFGVTPQIESVSDRRSRSTAYLLLLTDPPHRGVSVTASHRGLAPPARSDIASLRAISICASAFDHFLEGFSSYALEKHP